MPIDQITVLYDSDDFVVVSKPPGLSVHDDHADGGGLLRAAAILVGAEKLLPVHRLDKMTSGVIVMAKHAEANRLIAEQFARRQVEKYYLAISNKKPRKKQGLIEGDMCKSRRSAWKLLPSKDNPAQTQLFSYSLGQGRRLYVLRPHTGKTHQIRVAMKSIAAPILGDALYGGDEADRGYLHAYVLRFKWREEQLSFVDLPRHGVFFEDKTVTEVLASLGEPWQMPWPKVKHRDD